MKRTLIVALGMVIALAVDAQEESKFGVKFSGFVKNDFFWDSRQTVAAREGHFLLWPSPELLDANGEDINADASFNFLAIQSRLGASLKGPDAFGAKTSGLIEGDFFAQANDNINLFRLRHAFIKLNWTHLEVMAGQFWNPLFVTGCFPGTVSFNTGTPLQSFARNPQLRFTYKTGGFSILAAALSQRDYSNVGESGGSSSYLRNSSVPDMHLQLHYGTSNESGINVLAGAGMAYKTIVPRTSSTITGNTYKVNEKVGGLTAIAFSKLTSDPVTVKLQVRYGENISDLLAISGFGVSDIVDLSTGERAYTPLKSMTFWGEIHTNGNPQVGIFGGLTSNNGTKEALAIPGTFVFGRATTIRTLFRISPRIQYNAGKVRLAAEVEYTNADYGSGYDEFYIPSETTSVANLRALFAIYYFF
ncbi:MAG: hypothetical protein ABFS28_00970 [Bacteroidota bacterium]